MQATDGIHRRGESTPLPRRHIRGMLAREDDAPVYGAQIVVVLGASFLGPHAETAEREGGAVPGDRNTVLELSGVLRMNAAAVLDCLRDSLLRRHGREL